MQRQWHIGCRRSAVGQHIGTTSHPPQRHYGSHQAADQRDRQLQDGQRLEEDPLLREDELRVGDRHLLKALDVDVPRLQFLRGSVQGVSRCGGLSQEQRNQQRAMVLAARAAKNATPMPVDACAPTRLQNRLHGGAAVDAPCESRRWAAAPAQPSPARPAAAAASRPSRPPASTLTLGCGQSNETSEVKLEPAAVLLGSITASGAGHNNHADVLLGSYGLGNAPCCGRAQRRT